MNKKIYLKSLLLCFLIIVSTSLCFAEKKQMISGNWIIEYDESSKTIDFIQSGNPVLTGVFVKAIVDGVEISSANYSQATFSNSTENDETGISQKHTIEYTQSGKPTIRQIFYLYSNKDFLLTEVIISSPGAEKISSNYIAPIYTVTRQNILPKSADNRMLTIPYDNDGFITYGSFPLDRDTISFEATGFFNGNNQNGLVIGSVEHRDWKSAIRMSASENTFIDKLICYNGVSHAVTRDEIDGFLQPHGAIRNQEIKSSRIMIGYFDDWRTGLETYGDINAAIAPRRNWDKGVPFGWNSWGGMETHVNYAGIISVSDFIKENLQENNFINDNTVYVGLDSYWDNLNDTELKQFADHCYANGQIPGIYWTPFCDWFGWSRAIDGSTTWNYQDTWTMANGKYKSVCGAKCMDPTHPGTLERMRYFVNRFKQMGFKYIKLDFLVNGAIEADFFYEKGITTGTQAYNYGMSYLKELCGDDIFFVQSISPLFPADYSHARRISCDAWGEMWHTQYMMNSFSFGWWLDRVYVFNDADHLVMGDRSEGENRARITSGAISGLYMLGDNLSTTGNYVGTQISQDKVKKFATNPYINDIARIKKKFRPAYGHITSSVSGAIDLFTCETNDCYYIAYFNYGSNAKTGYLDLEALGINISNVSAAKECWMKIAANIENGKLRYSIPGNDARVYKLDKINFSSIKPPEKQQQLAVIREYADNQVTLKCSECFKKIKLISMSGYQLFKKIIPCTDKYDLSMNTYPTGMYIISVETESNKNLNTLFTLN